MNCEQCGKPLEAATKRKRFCSDKCRVAAFRNKKHVTESRSDRSDTLVTQRVTERQPYLSPEQADLLRRADQGRRSRRRAGKRSPAATPEQIMQIALEALVRAEAMKGK